MRNSKFNRYLWDEDSRHLSFVRQEPRFVVRRKEYLPNGYNFPHVFTSWSHVDKGIIIVTNLSIDHPDFDLYLNESLIIYLEYLDIVYNMIDKNPSLNATHFFTGLITDKVTEFYEHYGTRNS